MTSCRRKDNESHVFLWPVVMTSRRRKGHELLQHADEKVVKVMYLLGLFLRHHGDEKVCISSADEELVSWLVF